MRLVQARFVTACQQLLALGVVLAVLTPASGVISLDIVGAHPALRPVRRPAVISGALQRRPRVPTAVVEPTVTEVPLTDARRQRPRARRADRGRWLGHQQPGHQQAAGGRRATAPSASPGRTARTSPTTSIALAGAHPRGRHVERLGRPGVPRRPRPRRRQPEARPRRVPGPTR